jgi:hypothetical protein
MDRNWFSLLKKTVLECHINRDNFLIGYIQSKYCSYKDLFLMSTRNLYAWLGVQFIVVFSNFLLATPFLDIS